MGNDDSVSKWLKGVKEGDSLAAQQVWNRYFEQLARLARGKLARASRRMADEEDVALSAFQSFLSGAERGRFPQLDDREDLWRILVTITERKAWRQIEQQRCQKRGGGAVRGESVFGPPEGSAAGGWDGQAGPDPTPEFAALMAEEVNRLLVALDTDLLRRVAVMKMQAYSVEEMARELQLSPRSIKRKLVLIREIWSH